MSVGFDALGLWAVYRLARRRGSWWGVVAWLALLPLLGPVSYTRLDMAVGGVHRVGARTDRGQTVDTGGAWLGLGTAIKITPGLLVPAVVLAAPKRWRPAAAASLVGLVFVTPFITDLPELWDQVIGYHTDRGVHAESLWGSSALAARVFFGASVKVVPAFGAADIERRSTPACASSRTWRPSGCCSTADTTAARDVLGATAPTSSWSPAGH